MIEVASGISRMNSLLDETKPVIWIVDREQWPRANLRALLLDHGFDALGFMELDGALAALKDPHYPKPFIVVLELHGLSPTEEEVDALTRLSIPMVGLAGAVEMSQEWIRKIHWAALIQRPNTIGQVVDTIERLVRVSKRKSHD
jgi:hypothetical protein